jgi:hypothetical protein
VRRVPSNAIASKEPLRVDISEALDHRGN